MKKNSVYSMVKEFKRKYPFTVAWRLKAHCKVIEKHLNKGEHVIYAFVGQKNFNSTDIFTTYVVTLTNKRILLAQKRVFFGYFLITITPDMFNDLKVKMGLFWGKVLIDTVKELIVISNIQKSALDEIETQVSEYILREKPKYYQKMHEEKIKA